MQSPDLVVGIDLGTTNSAIAAVIDDQVQVIPVHGQRTMPSAVAIDPSGRVVVGQAAKNQAISAPENTLLSIKRLMGTDETVTLGDKTYRPEEISAIILSELKKAAESHLKQPVNHAVITVPAFFNERQRQATQDAGRIAGLEVLRIINEPTAAALAYGAGRDAAAPSENILVYDLGGGTFDVSLVTVENGIVEVRASHGDTHLGGDDFDELLVQHTAEKFLTDASPALRRRLKAVMENAKIQLSDAPFVHVREEFITSEEHLDSEVDRMKYNEAILPLLEKTLECLQRAIADSGITTATLSKVLLVGGATRTPFVQEILRDRLGREAHHEVDPDLIVAMGAAIQGSALAGRPAPAILVDITPHSYSIAAIEYYDLVCNPIVRRGTALPARKSELYSTLHDNQEAVEVMVYQGESRSPEDNLRIGEFRITGLSKVPAGNRLVVTFEIDLNGMLTVTAAEKSTGLAKTVTIDTGGQHRVNLDTARASLAELIDDFDEDFVDEDDDEVIDLDTAGDDEPDSESNTDGSAAGAESGAASSKALLASAKSLRRRAAAMIEGGALAEADAASLRVELDAISQCITASDWTTLETHTHKLSDLLFYLED